MLLFEISDDWAGSYDIVKGSMARTFATAGSCIGMVAASWVEYLRPSTFKEGTTWQDGMSAYMKLETNEDMFGEFGESDGTLFQKACILKGFE